MASPLRLVGTRSRAIRHRDPALASSQPWSQPGLWQFKAKCPASGSIFRRANRIEIMLALSSILAPLSVAHFYVAPYPPVETIEV